MALPPPPREDLRVLSIQSHVVQGYVGNKSAVFPLQVLGIEVDPINSVQFSNHTGYASFTGEVLQGEQLERLVEGLEANGLLGGIKHGASGSSNSGGVGGSGASGAAAGAGGSDAGGDGGDSGVGRAGASAAGDVGSSGPDGPTQGGTGGYSHLLTGYVGSLSFLRAVARVAETLRAHNPSLCWVCDPVMGDRVVGASSGAEKGEGKDADGRNGGKLYVPAELVDVYREEIVPLATVLTPNQYEAELLTGESIETLDDACRVCKLLHDMGKGVPGRLELIVLTSLELDKQPQRHPAAGGRGADLADQGQDHDGGIVVVASERRDDGQIQQFFTTVPRIDGHFTGTGDLIAALLLAWRSRLPNDLPQALCNSLATTRAVLARTHAHAAAANPAPAGAPNKGGAVGELRLIQSMQDILQPPTGSFRAERV